MKEECSVGQSARSSVQMKLGGVSDDVMATLPTSDNLKRQVNRFKRKRNDAPPAVTPEDLLDLVIQEQYKVNIFSTLYRVIGTPRVVIHLDTINLVYTLIYIVPSQCQKSQFRAACHVSTIFGVLYKITLRPPQ